MAFHSDSIRFKPNNKDIPGPGEYQPADIPEPLPDPLTLLKPGETPDDLEQRNRLTSPPEHKPVFNSSEKRFMTSNDSEFIKKMARRKRYQEETSRRADIIEYVKPTASFISRTRRFPKKRKKNRSPAVGQYKFVGFADELLKKNMKQKVAQFMHDVGGELREEVQKFRGFGEEKKFDGRVGKEREPLRAVSKVSRVSAGGKGSEVTGGGGKKGGKGSGGKKGGEVFKRQRHGLSSPELLGMLNYKGRGTFVAAGGLRTMLKRDEEEETEVSNNQVIMGLLLLFCSYLVLFCPSGPDFDHFYSIFSNFFDFFNFFEEGRNRPKMEKTDYKQG